MDNPTGYLFFRSILFLTLLTIIGLIILPIPLLFYHRFFLVFISLFLGLLLLKEDSVVIYNSDIYWGIFLFVCVLSSFYSINISLVWLPLINWITLVLLMLIIRQNVIDLRVTRLLHQFLLVIFWIVLIGVVIVYIVRDNLIHDYYPFGYNQNYISLLVVALWPFLFYIKSASFKSVMSKLMGFFLILFLLSQTLSKGAVLIFVLVNFLILCFAFIKSINLKLLKICLFFVLSMAIVILVFGNDLLNISWEKNDNSRLFLIKESIIALIERPFLGCGLGNWFSGVFKNNLDSYLGLQNDVFFRDISHNLFSSLAVEIGFFGVVSYSYTHLIILFDGLSNFNKKVEFKKAIILSILIIVLGSFIYASSFGSIQFYSGIQFLLFLLFGILSSNYSYEIIGRIDLIYIKSVLLLASILFLVLYCFDLNFSQALSANDYQKISKAKKLDNIYNDFFITSYGKYPAGSNASIDLMIAEECIKENSFVECQSFYERGMIKFPNDDRLKLSYSKYLVFEKCDFERALNLLLDIYKKQSLHNETNALIAIIYLKMGFAAEAMKFLDTTFTSRQNDIVGIAELIYFSEITNWYPFNLDSAQKKNIMNYFISDVDIKELEDSYYTTQLSSTYSDKIQNVATTRVKFEKYLSDVLTTDQIEIYVNFIVNRLVGDQFWLLCWITDLEDQKKVFVHNVLTDSFKKQKFNQILRHQCQSKECYNNIDNELKNLQNSLYLDLKQVLSNSQYLSLINYDVIRRWFLLNRF